jgi:hypothetical protein
MKATEFAAQIKKSVVDENVGIYRELFENSDKASDPYWKRALHLYSTLDASQKEVFFEIIRQVAIDTISNVFAIVDGVAQLDGQDGDCSLTCGTDRLSGELQDQFLVHFEG